MLALYRAGTGENQRSCHATKVRCLGTTVTHQNCIQDIKFGQFLLPFSSGSFVFPSPA